MELRPAEVGGIEAGAILLEEYLSSSSGTAMVDDAMMEMYISPELEEMTAEDLSRWINLYWAQVCMSMAEQYFLRAAGTP